jgi:hypothetical protein
MVWKCSNVQIFRKMNCSRSIQDVILLTFVRENSGWDIEYPQLIVVLISPGKQTPAGKKLTVGHDHFIQICSNHYSFTVLPVNVIYYGLPAVSFKTVKLAPQLHSFVTWAPDGGEWSASRRGRLSSGEIAHFPTDYEAGWAPELVRKFWRREKCPAPTGIGTPYRPPSSLVTILRP